MKPEPRPSIYTGFRTPPVFRNGGFPRPTSSQNQWQVKQSLTKDLLPL